VKHPQAPNDAPPLGLAIHLLGPPRVERGGEPAPAPRGHKVWGLLAYLARSEAAVSRKHLAGLLFEDAEDPLAALRWNLSELRRLLGTAELRGELIALPAAPATYVDLGAVLSGSWAQALCVPGLDRELLEGMNFSGSPAFEVWLATERRHLQAAAEAVLREAAQARMAAGAMARSRRAGRPAGSAQPAGRELPGAAGAQPRSRGRRRGAARQAAACRELFQRELGVQPGATLDAALRTLTAAPTARPATGRAAALAQLEAGEAAISAGALDAGLQCLRRAIAEADATGDAVLRARTRVALGGALVHAARGRDEEGATALHEALEVGHDVSPVLAAAACRELGYVEFLRGRYERTLAWLQRAQAHWPARTARSWHASPPCSAPTLSDTAHYAPPLPCCAKPKHWPPQWATTSSSPMRCPCWAARCCCTASSTARPARWTARWPWPSRAGPLLCPGRNRCGLKSTCCAATSMPPRSRFEHAFALGCQIGDPCWEGIAGRGLGRVAMARGEPQRAVEILTDALARCTRLPDSYLWGKGHLLDALCGVAVAQAMPQASAWINEMQELAARSGMRELTVRACLHRAALGDSASARGGKAACRPDRQPRAARPRRALTPAARGSTSKGS
jgi:DNA-binding SARP family transcriptional activator